MSSTIIVLFVDAHSSSAPDELPCEVAALPTVSSPTLLPLSIPESEPSPFTSSQLWAHSSTPSSSSPAPVVTWEGVLELGALVEGEMESAGEVVLEVVTAAEEVATPPPPSPATAGADVVAVAEEVQEEEVVLVVVSLFVFGLVVGAGLDSKP